MASTEKNLSVYSEKNIVDISWAKIAVIVAEWNHEITETLFEGTNEVLLKHGARRENILRFDVPGSYELAFAANELASFKTIDAVICIGCIIQGETKHFDFIANALAESLMNVSVLKEKPVIFGVLTTNNKQQALERAGGKHGNKGEEAGAAAVKMLGFKLDVNKIFRQNVVKGKK
jgi:6,7-dimethyl-8-ribityllumazine synthase